MSLRRFNIRHSCPSLFSLDQLDWSTICSGQNKNRSIYLWLQKPICPALSGSGRDPSILIRVIWEISPWTTGISNAWEDGSQSRWLRAYWSKKGRNCVWKIRDGSKVASWRLSPESTTDSHKSRSNRPRWIYSSDEPSFLSRFRDACTPFPRNSGNVR